ncbi:protein vav-like [Anastrepha obliqua]|uniref:protein vav-like n=1 Tax=Anastrepha obliqua TaxID=95512 RepID=UPI002409002B|nr:protein vav-like [Anastrepha obliqua]
MANNSSSSGGGVSGGVLGAAGGGSAGGNNDLWRECVAWLTRCKIIPPDHKANWPDSEIRVLALTLRDGVLLCNLVIYLDSNSMDPRDFNRKPQMAQVS